MVLWDVLGQQKSFITQPTLCHRVSILSMVQLHENACYLKNDCLRGGFLNETVYLT
jgi:hypothetical protein